VHPGKGVEEPDLATIGRFLEVPRPCQVQWPERIELVSELPMTNSGKVSKPLMREIIAAKLKAEAGETHAVTG